MSDIATQTTTPSNSSVVLEVRGLVKEYRKAGSPFKRADTFEAVSNVSLDVRQGEIVCLLGESGCGKTTLARMIMHLTRPTAGTITLNGCEMQGLNERRFRPLRQYIQMVYQNPFDCLDPSRRVGSLLEEPLKLWHPELSKEERTRRISGMLQECGLDESCLVKKPRQFSGGQLQRLSIARALLVDPKLLTSSSRTTSPLPEKSPTGSLSCTEARLSASEPLTNCSRTRAIPTSESLQIRCSHSKDARIRRAACGSTIPPISMRRYIERETRFYSSSSSMLPLTGSNVPGSRPAATTPSPLMHMT